MIEGIQIKVCGLTSQADADFAEGSGADYLGFILHSKSPRFVSLDRFRSLNRRISAKHRVAVVVEPTSDALSALRGEGFDRFQVHFRHDLPVATIEGWTKAVGAKDLWLAPKLPPSVDVAAEWAGLSDTVLLDTFDPSLFGGTGRTGDWAKFRRHAEGDTGRTWILSGGLGPENIASALSGSGARFVDVNSGVESSPGIKDQGKVTTFFAAVREAAASGG